MRQCVAETHPKSRPNSDDFENGAPGAPQFPLVAPSGKIDSGMEEQSE
jgi:hypothetical protein